MFYAFALTLDIIILDQVSKYLVLRFWPQISTINPNVAFSIPIPNVVMFFITPVLIAIFIFLFMRYGNFPSRYSIAAFGFLVGGGVSNFIDRIFRDGVVDFIDLGFWPSFNFADSFITIGAFLLLFFHAKILVNP